MSVSLPDQLRQILDVTGRSLSGVHAYQEKEVEYEVRRQESAQQQREKLKKIQRGEWHDGRLDCIAGNGIMSELGIGDERFDSDDADVATKEVDSLEPEIDEGTKPGDSLETKGLPVVVIRGFEDKVGGNSEFLDVVARWATSLVDNKVSKRQTSAFWELIRTSRVKIAHVIVLSDNRENAKRLTKGIEITDCSQMTYMIL